MRIGFRPFAQKMGPTYTFDNFFCSIVKYSDPFGPGCQSFGIEDQVDNTAKLVGNLIESLVIRGVFNVDDVDRIIGSWHPKVEIIDGEEDDD